MGSIGTWLKRLLPRNREAETLDVTELRLAFKARYHDFRQLLAANNRALEIMAEIEEALAGTKPFGMIFVRSWCTRVSTRVFRIVRHLGALAPGKYDGLVERFQAIRKLIEPHLQADAAPAGSPMVLPIAAIDMSMVDMVGGKMTNLAHMRNNLGMTVPGGFVVTAAGYRRFMEHSDLQPEINH